VQDRLGRCGGKHAAQREDEGAEPGGYSLMNASPPVRSGCITAT
jgi:hypothetical protein